MDFRRGHEQAWIHDLKFQQKKIRNYLHIYGCMDALPANEEQLYVWDVLHEQILHKIVGVQGVQDLWSSMNCAWKSVNRLLGGSHKDVTLSTLVRSIKFSDLSGNDSKIEIRKRIYAFTDRYGWHWICTTTWLGCWNWGPEHLFAQVVNNWTTLFDIFRSQSACVFRPEVRSGFCIQKPIQAGLFILKTGRSRDSRFQGFIEYYLLSSFWVSLLYRKELDLSCSSRYTTETEKLKVRNCSRDWWVFNQVWIFRGGKTMGILNRVLLGMMCWSIQLNIHYSFLSIWKKEMDLNTSTSTMEISTFA